MNARLDEYDVIHRLIQVCNTTTRANFRLAIEITVPMARYNSDIIKYWAWYSRLPGNAEEMEKKNEESGISKEVS
jgi:hypothetical protein